MSRRIKPVSVREWLADLGTTTDIGNALGVSPYTVVGWKRRGQIPSPWLHSVYKLSHNWGHRISAERVLEMMASSE